MIANNNEGATMIASAPVQLPPTLTVTQATGVSVPQGAIPVNSSPFVIGRTEGSLVIPEPNVSRRHAQISYDTASRAYLLTDLNSSNGTRLNGQRLATGQSAPLMNGAVIGLGPNVSIRFNLS